MNADDRDSMPRCSVTSTFDDNDNDDDDDDGAGGDDDEVRQKFRAVQGRIQAYFMEYLGTKCSFWGGWGAKRNVHTSRDLSP